MSRRDILMAFASLGLLGVGISAGRGVIRFLTPPVSQARPAIIIAGPPADFPQGALTPVPGGPVLIGRDEAGLFALLEVCTHLGCTVARQGQELACPCHGSRFALNGTHLAGPATRPLAYLALTLNADGLIEVNLGKAVEANVRLAV
jgi:menaquinol-cytochrome c reductase iron-sulfur subunit